MTVLSAQYTNLTEVANMSLFSVFRSGDMIQIISVVLSRIFIVFFCMPIHECAHAWAADKMGDHTAKNLGRMTLNPFSHLDLVGTIMIFLFGIGYANPVPVNERNFRNPKKGMALTALAGPASNLFMGFVAVSIYYGVMLLPHTTAVTLIAFIFYYAASVNVTLAVFNLLPIPPLDGSKVAAMIIPNKYYYKYLQYERYIMIGLIVLLFTGILNRPIGFISDIMMWLISFIPNLIYGIFA